MSDYGYDDVATRPGSPDELDILSFAAPAAGAEFSITVPGGEVWELHTLLTKLTTDATVANRHLELTLDDGNTVYERVPTSAATPASTLVTMQYVVGSPGAYGASNKLMLAFGAIAPVLFPGHRIRSSTLNLQAADQVGTQVLRIRRVRARSLAGQIAVELRRQLEELGAIDRAAGSY